MYTKRDLKNIPQVVYEDRKLYADPETAPGEYIETLHEAGYARDGECWYINDFYRRYDTGEVQRLCYGMARYEGDKVCPECRRYVVRKGEVCECEPPCIVCGQPSLHDYCDDCMFKEQYADPPEGIDF